MQEKWAIVTCAIDYSVDDPDVVYQLNERRNVLLRLCVAWDPAVKIIPMEENLSWGPDLANLANTRHFESVNIQIMVENQHMEDFNISEMDENMEDRAEGYLEEEMEMDVEDEIEAELMDEFEMAF